MTRADGRAADRWALVLAGGDGVRLQELTRRITGTAIPKQYCPLLDGQSLLEATLLRARHFVPPERTFVIVNKSHLDVAGEQLRHVPAENVIVQPLNRDTGPGMSLALLNLARRCATATVAVFPSDHFVSDDRAFMSHVAHGADLVDSMPQSLVLLGVAPDRPETAYGYILPGQRLAASGAEAFRVRAFHEKPTPPLAQTLCEQGALWNSFVTVLRLDAIFDLLHRAVPEHFDQMRRMGEPERASAAYCRLSPWNFSSTFLARVPQRLVVVRVAGVHWNDWGTEASIERSLRLLNRKPPWSGKALSTGPRSSPAA